MKQSRKPDLKCYDNPEFYNKYTRALGQADSGLISFIDNFSVLIDRLFYIITVVSIISALDPMLILFGIIYIYVILL